MAATSPTPQNPIKAAFNQFHGRLHCLSLPLSCCRICCGPWFCDLFTSLLQCFHGHGGRAFLFERCVNVTAGHPEHRVLMTGMHVVADITCSSCGTELGWKYVSLLSVIGSECHDTRARFENNYTAPPLRIDFFRSFIASWRLEPRVI